MWACLCQMLLSVWNGESSRSPGCLCHGKHWAFPWTTPPPCPGFLHLPIIPRGPPAVKTVLVSRKLGQPQDSASIPPPLTHTPPSPPRTMLSSHLEQRNQKTPTCKRRQRPLFLAASVISIASPSLAGRGNSAVPLTKADLFFGSVW